jgi:cysteine desulfuration protein SufE
MYESCLEKQKKIKALFSSCETEEQKYDKIIELGKHLDPFDPSYKTEDRRVTGCQSLMYLHSTKQEDKICFNASSDALISSGLAYLLIAVYSGETAETILKCPPNYLQELNITDSLTPNRANGLYSMHLKMKQEALKCLVDEHR